MRITDIRVDRFGVWQHLDLPLRGSALHVCYGPNGSGKTTLMHFLRGVLYGFQREELVAARKAAARRHNGAGASEFDSENEPWDVPAGGAIRIEHEGRYYEIARRVDMPPTYEGTNGSATLRTALSVRELTAPSAGEWLPTQFSGDNDSTINDQRLLSQLLDGTNEELFRRVFAIGFGELRAFTELAEGEVAQQIYGLTLGAEGRQLTRTLTMTEQARERFFRSDANDLRPWLSQERKLAEELAGIGDRRRHYHDLCQQRDTLEARIEELNALRRDLQQNVRGQTTVVRYHEPWERVKELEAEIARLPAVTTVVTREAQPRDDRRLRQLKAEYKTAKAEYQVARRKARELSREVSRSRRVVGTTAEPDRYASVRGLIGQRPWLLEAQTQIEQAEATANECQRDFEARQKALGPDWPIKRVQQVDTGFTAYYRLSDMGRIFEMASGDRDKQQKLYKKVAQSVHQRRKEYDAAIRELPEGSLKAAIAGARLQIREGEEIAKRRLHQREIEQRIINLKRELTRLESRPDLPRWAPGFLLFLGLGGAILSGLGFITGLTSNGIAGLILATIGLAGFFIAQAFRLHSEGHINDDLAELRMRIRTHQAELTEMRLQNRQLGLVDDERGRNESIEEQETRLITAGTRRLSELKRLAIAHRQIRKSRRRLQPLKRRFQESQRAFDAARQQWCELVRQHGLPESLQVDETLFIWQTVAEVSEHHQAWQTAREQVESKRQQWRQWQRRIEEAGKQAKLQADYSKPADVLSQWATQMKEAPATVNTAARVEVDTKLQERARAARRGLSPHKRTLSGLRRQIRIEETSLAAIPNESGIDTKQLQLQQQRSNLQARLEEARALLAKAQQESGDLAIVESDMQAYGRGERRVQDTETAKELREIEQELKQLEESLRRVKHEIRELEEDRRPARLRAERAAVRAEIKQRLRRWAATETAADVMLRVRSFYERDGQPGTLAHASEYLAQLTDGRHRRVWTPFGEQRLMVEDERGTSFAVEQLSHGTREQLFLAIRMAVVRQYANDGIELPLVLDDVLVNFDEHRAETAIATLADFAEQGQQVLLFTCHKHQAQAAERHGTHPIWLPGYNATTEPRRAG